MNAKQKYPLEGAVVSLNTPFTAQDRIDFQAVERMPVLAFTRQHLDVSIHFHKQSFYRRGIFSTPRVRKQTVAWDSFHRRCGDELIAYLKDMEARQN